MTSGLAALALGVDRVLAYGGFVLVAGTLTFWTLLWPDGRSERRLVVTTAVGAAAMALATFGDPAVQILLDGQPAAAVLRPLIGGTLLLRLAALAAVAFFLADVARAAVRGWWRIFAVVVTGVLAATLVVPSDALAAPWPAAKIPLATGHVLATAVWLGALVALAVVLIPAGHPGEVGPLVRRFWVLTTICVAVLGVTGIAQALLVAGGLAPLLASRYGLVAGVKTLVFVVMLVLARYIRAHAAREAFRRAHPLGLAGTDTASAGTAGPGTPGPGARALTLLLGVEVGFAAVLLATSAVLVTVAPST